MGTRSANEKANNNFAGIYGGSMGARGVQTLDANFDKSFVTAVWSFVTVSPGTIS